jgi:Holliday junction resolvase-like predicted endonuclease
MAKTITTGNKGEAFIHLIAESQGFKVLNRWNDDSKYDFIISNGEITKSIEVKTQPQFKKYGGFSIEIGNKRLGNYLTRKTEFIWEGSPCVYTGLAVTQSDIHVFTNGKNIAYAISTKVLIEWFERVKTQEIHRIKFGGNYYGSLQVQIKIEELEKIAQKIDITRKRGPKASQVARK